MSETNKSYRVRTNVGEDKILNVNLNQNYDTLEILSLKLNQNNAYNVHTSNYGVIVGRVLANGGFGIPNAKISVFIPLNSKDTIDAIKAALYPYNSTMSEDENGVKYNLLPNFNINECHQPVGTFPSKEFVLDNDNTLEIFDTYYKFTTRTNNAGDYMLFGVPTGNQNLHVDLDLSDIGFLSQRPRDLIYKGYNATQFENPNQFKIDSNLNSLAQLFSQDTTVNVYSFWGDNADETVAVTRADIQIQYKFEPTCVFMGSVVSDSPSNGISKRCKPATNMGVMGELTTGSGTIEMIRKTPQNTVEEFQIQGNELINGDGVWCYQIPMNLDYVVTDEYGNIIPTDDPSKGIPTRTKVRFRVGLQEFDNITSDSVRSKFLIPHNPSTPQGYDYVFGTLTKDDSYRDLFWNNVYTIKSYIPRFQKGNWNTTMKFTGFKQVNHNGSLNPIPYNNIRIKMSFMFIIMCALIKSYIFIIELYNWLMRFLPEIDISLCTPTFKILRVKIRICIPPGKIQWFVHQERTCMYIGGGLCPGLESWYFAPGCGYTTHGVNTSEGWSMRQNTLTKAIEGELYSDPKSIDSKNATPPENTCITTEMDYFIQCIEINLAQEYKVIQFDFYNDWVNGLLYIPRWFREVRRKKNFLFGLISVKEKIKACTVSYFNNARDFTQQCAMDYVEHANTGIFTKIINAKGCDGSKQRCHKRGGRKQYGIFGSQGGIINDTILNSDGIEMHYFKPNEFSGNGRKVQLFATDIVLLGSLNDCDLNGVPQAFKDLTSSSYKMPDNLATTNLDVEGYLYGANSTNTVCTPNNITHGLTTITQDFDVQTSLLRGTESQVNEIVSDAIENIPLTELSGMDWGFTGPGQDRWYDDTTRNPLANDLDTLYFPGGHFLGISCTQGETNIKSCVNLSRVCEQGVWLSQRQDKISSVSDDGLTYNYTAISPHGLIGRDEISDSDFRSIFATMNQNRLKTIKDEKTGYLKYDFIYNANSNFAGDLSDKIGWQYFTKVTPNNSVLSPSTNPEIKYIEYRRALEQVNADYYKFRLGLNDLENKDETYNKYLNLYYYNGLPAVSLPMYENSFYFYFGLHDGSTAIDEFNKQYFSNCISNKAVSSELDILTKNIDLCDVCDYNLPDCTPSGIANVDIINMTPDFEVVLTLNNNNEDYSINATEYEGKPNLIWGGETLFEVQWLKPGNYEVTVIDVNNNVVSQTFIIGESYITSDVGVTPFTVDVDEKFNSIENDIDKYTAIIEDDIRGGPMGYGGILTTNLLSFLNGKTYKIGELYEPIEGELYPQILIINRLSKTYVDSINPTLKWMSENIRTNLQVDGYSELPYIYNEYELGVNLWESGAEYQIYLYYSCKLNEYDKYTILNTVIVDGVTSVNFKIGESNTITYKSHFRDYINQNSGGSVTPWWTESGSKKLFTNIVDRDKDLWYLKKTLFKEDINVTSKVSIYPSSGTPPWVISLIGQPEYVDDNSYVRLKNISGPENANEVSGEYSLTLNNILTPTYNYENIDSEKRLMFGVRVNDSTYDIDINVNDGIIPNAEYDKGYVEGFGGDYENYFVIPIIYKPFYYQILTWISGGNNIKSNGSFIETIPNYNEINAVKSLINGQLSANIYNGITYNENGVDVVKLAKLNINGANDEEDGEWVEIDTSLPTNNDFYINPSLPPTINGRVVSFRQEDIGQLPTWDGDEVNNLAISSYTPLNESDSLYAVYPPITYTEKNNVMFFNDITFTREIITPTNEDKIHITASYSANMSINQYCEYLYIPIEDESKLSEFNEWWTNINVIDFNSFDMVYNLILEKLNATFDGIVVLEVIDVLDSEGRYRIDEYVPTYKYSTVIAIYNPFEVDEYGEVSYVDSDRKLDGNELNYWSLLKQYDVIVTGDINKPLETVNEFKINANNGLYVSPLSLPTPLKDFVVIDWGDGNKTELPIGFYTMNGESITHTYEMSGDYTITMKIGGDDVYRFGYYQNTDETHTKTLLSVDSLLLKGQTDASYMFNNCNNLTSLPLIDVNGVKQINNAFDGCVELSDIGGLYNLNNSIDISDSILLSENSLKNIINGLANVDVEQILTLSTESFEKLTVDDVDNATLKGWSIEEK